MSLTLAPVEGSLFPQLQHKAHDRLPLEDLATDAAHAWVERVLGELERQSRPITGGWPGTLSEARAQVAAGLVANPPAARVSGEVLETLAKRVYALARREWLSKTSTLA